MNAEEKHRVLDYIDKFSGVFNDMMREVTKRIISNQPTSDLESFLQQQKPVSDGQASVKIDPQKFISQQMAFLEKQQRLWQNASKAMMGAEFEPVIEQSRSDKRFKDADWQGNPAFNYIKQAYLLNSEYLNQLVDVMEFEDKGIEEQVRFYTRQFINSMSPSNYVLTNPEVCREILSSQGENLAKGIDNFMHDLERSPNEAFKITQVTTDSFTLGKDLATTPGKVVYQNKMIQLIHYTPTVDNVYATPMLIVPPFINKYYILDLDEKKSMVRWLLSEGHNVFLISWNNPDESYAHMPFDDYVNDGLLAAMDAIAGINGAKKVNVTGYCVGGTVAAITQAYLAKINDQRIQSLTFLTTLLDFSEPGELGVYLTEQMLPAVQNSARQKGYLDGRILALSFSMLRENNLFWSYFVEYYLKGKDPMPFALLYWNSDSTNMPCDAFLYYLDNMYLENKLREPGGISVNGTPIDLADITTPTYCLAAQADHIVLWHAAYKSAQCLTGADLKFVLTESGHVAGVVNPAAQGKYPHWVFDELPETAQEWMENAKQQEGSWWNDWRDWLAERSGKMAKAPKVGSKKKYPVLEDAPGSYVMKRLDVIE